MSDPKKQKVGYKNPPRDGQFKPGVSGNPRGRPPKMERSFLPQQVILDILSITEGEVKIKTADGVTVIPAIQANLRRMMQRALEGHGPSMRFVHQIHEKAIQQNYERNKRRFSFLELWESEEVHEIPLENRNDFIKSRNRYRKQSRKLE